MTESSAPAENLPKKRVRYFRMSDVLTWAMYISFVAGLFLYGRYKLIEKGWIGLADWSYENCYKELVLPLKTIDAQLAMDGLCTRVQSLKKFKDPEGVKILNCMKVNMDGNKIHTLVHVSYYIKECDKPIN